MVFYINQKTGDFVVESLGDSMDRNYTMVNVNTAEMGREKHLPVVTVDDKLVTVDIGSAPHPMTAEHRIWFVVLETNHGYQLRKLCSGDEPKVVFHLVEGEKPLAVYDYCNLHGLWQTKL